MSLEKSKTSPIILLCTDKQTYSVHFTDWDCRCRTTWLFVERNRRHTTSSHKITIACYIVQFIISHVYVTSSSLNFQWICIHSIVYCIRQYWAGLFLPHFEKRLHRSCKLRSLKFLYCQRQHTHFTVTQNLDQECEWLVTEMKWKCQLVVFSSLVLFECECVWERERERIV